MHAWPPFFRKKKKKFECVAAAGKMHANAAGKIPNGTELRSATQAKIIYESRVLVWLYYRGDRTGKTLSQKMQFERFAFWLSQRNTVVIFQCIFFVLFVRKTTKCRRYDEKVLNKRKMNRF